MEQDIKKSVDTLTQALTEDAEYYYGWQSNIAMAVKDEYDRRFPNGYDKNVMHEIANSAAKNFLNLLISQSK